MIPRGPNDAQEPQLKRDDLWIYQGDDPAWWVEVYDSDGTTPADLTGYGVRAQIRKDAADRASVAAEMNAVIAMPAEGKISLSIPHAMTGTLSGKYVWDMQLVSGAGMVETILGGAVTVVNEVTRAVAV